MTKTKKPKPYHCFCGNWVAGSRKEETKQICKNLPFYKIDDDKSYCVLHYPKKEKLDDFEVVFQQMLKEENFDFRGVWFPHKLDLSDKIISKPVDFTDAVFTDEVNFNKTVFKQNVDFCGAIFQNNVDFSFSFFLQDVSFRSAKFEENTLVFFVRTAFKGEVSFNEAVCKGHLNFRGGEKITLEGGQERKKINPLFIVEKGSLDLQNVHFVSSGLISFHTVRLLPSWFVNVDSNKIEFTNIYWESRVRRSYSLDTGIRRTRNRKIWVSIKKAKPKSALRNLEQRNIADRHILLAKACLQIANNYMENNEFEEASKLRQIGMESRRLEHMWGISIFTMHWWYWLSSYYGESWRRAFVALLIILSGFAYIYTQIPFQSCPKDQAVATSLQDCKNSLLNCRCKSDGLNSEEAISHSLSTALFQNVEYRKPLTFWGEIFVNFEKILAPVQAALLALAIRRKFMR